MQDNNVDTLNHEEESRVTEIARLVAQLPVQEQEKVYYMLKGLEVLGIKEESES